MADRNVLRPPKRGGLPRRVITQEQRNFVTICKANGLTPEEIGAALTPPIKARSVEKWFAYELKTAKTRVLSKMGANVVRKGLEGDNSCMFFWLKTHGGSDWSERTRHEVTGEGGGPIRTSDLSNEDLDRLIAALSTAVTLDGTAVREDAADDLDRAPRAAIGGPRNPR